MKDERARYLIINSTDIYKQSYNLLGSDVCVKEIFDKYNIPEEFRKIIIKVSMSFFENLKVEEYTMGVPLEMSKMKLEEENNEKYISISNFSSLGNEQEYGDKIKVKTQGEFFAFEEVFPFLEKINDSNYFRLYLNVIKEFFDLNLDLDYLFEVWNQEKNAKKALKLYRKKYPKK